MFHSLLLSCVLCAEARKRVLCIVYECDIELFLVLARLFRLLSLAFLFGAESGLFASFFFLLSLDSGFFLSSFSLLLGPKLGFFTFLSLFFRANPRFFLLSGELLLLSCLLPALPDLLANQLGGRGRNVMPLAEVCGVRHVLSLGLLQHLPVQLRQLTFTLLPQARFPLLCLLFSTKFRLFSQACQFC